MEIAAVHVVIPARNEADLLPRCLRHVTAAIRELRSHRPHLAVCATVALDRCTDGSADIVRRARLRQVSVTAGCVGVARAAGIDHATAGTCTVGPDQVWIACTDADSAVPRTWLSQQVQLAEEGSSLIIGTVQPDPADLAPAAMSAWLARHTLAEGHQYVHGANLGFTLAAYRSVGGFEPLAVHEDVQLVRALQHAGIAWRSTDLTRVTTSGRSFGRTSAGFAGYLRDLSTSLRSPPRPSGAT